MSGSRALAWILAVSLAPWAAASVSAQQPPSLTPVPATAPPPSAAPAGPSADPKERARTAYARGQSAFSAGDYATAKDAFQQAFEAVPNPIVLLSVAESASKLGKLDEAIAAFDR